jgi:inosine-uridine nucleoside N-ribohydrolase
MVFSSHALASVCLILFASIRVEAAGAKGARQLKGKTKLYKEDGSKSKSTSTSKGKSKGKGKGKGKGGAQPIILDSDYGPFIDDVFALGLLLNSGDLLDLKYVLATSEDSALSAGCITGHLDLAQRLDVPVGVGAPFPDYSVRGGVCAIPGLIGFALEGICGSSTLPYDDDGIAAVAKMIMDSDRDDWWYLVVGGQSSVKVLVEMYPEAAAKIETLIVMGGNFCADFQPYPDVDAPTDETNVSCDPGAANFVLDQTNVSFKNIYYVPVVVADVIGGEDYAIFAEAALSGSDPVAASTLQYYKFWSEAGRADPDLLIHLEALEYDPETESTPQFDPVAVMLALQLLDDEDCEDRMALFEFTDGLRISEPGDSGLMGFPDAPRAGFSYIPSTLGSIDLPSDCPAITPFDFVAADTPAVEAPVMVTLGFTSPEAKASVYKEMALRMAGKEFPKCVKKGKGSMKSTKGSKGEGGKKSKKGEGEKKSKEEEGKGSRRV